jgi:UPF0271 protein
MKINLNADLGESFGAYTIGNDQQLLQVVASANLACGFHGGDALVMSQTVERAHAAGVSLGAHPSFPDLQGFGRREMRLAPNELEAMIIYQVGALDGIARAQGCRVTHVKPHGALNNMACVDAAIAKTVARAIKVYNQELILLAPVLSELAAAGATAGLLVALEVFADRAYTDQGQLVPRNHSGAVLHTVADAVQHVIRMLDAKGIVSVNGKLLPVNFHSICVHGDNAHAVETAIQVRAVLETAGFCIVPLPEIFC